MAKKKRSRRGPSLIMKAINVGVLLLALSPAIKRLLSGAPAQSYVDIYSAGLAGGTFNKVWAMEAYGPIVAAILLKKAISMLRKSVRV